MLKAEYVFMCNIHYKYFNNINELKEFFQQYKVARLIKYEEVDER